MAHTLMSAVQQAAFFKQTKAKISQDTDGDVYVHDCPSWGRENTMLLRMLRPNADVTVHQSATSLSGFALRVREPPLFNPHVRVCVAAVAALLPVLLIIAARWLAAMPE